MLAAEALLAFSSVAVSVTLSSLIISAQLINIAPSGSPQSLDWYRRTAMSSLQEEHANSHVGMCAKPSYCHMAKGAAALPGVVAVLGGSGETRHEEGLKELTTVPLWFPLLRPWCSPSARRMPVSPRLVPQSVTSECSNY